YYARPLDKAMEAPSNPCIYIAQINLLQMGASYVIDKVIQQPFHDYVVNPTLLYKLLLASKFTADKSEYKDTEGSTEPLEVVEEKISSFPLIETDFERLMPQPLDEEQEQ